MKKIVVIGAGGHGRETVQLIKDINRVSATWDLLGYLDDDPATTGQIRNGCPVLGTTRLLESAEWQGVHLVCAIGDARARKAIVERLVQTIPRLFFATLIHPTAVIGDETVIGEGTMVAAHSVITTHVQIGRHVIVNYGSTIGHDGRIGDFANVFPGANLSGHVTVGAEATVGAGAVILPGMEVGSRSIVGAGAVVTRPIPPDCTAVGVPARPIRFHPGSEAEEIEEREHGT